MTNFSLSPSGSNFKGDSPGSAVVGDTVPVWNPATKQWQPKTLPASGGEFVNLSNGIFLDQETAATSLVGNIEAPFSTFPEALAATPDGAALLIATYVAEAEESFNLAKNLWIRGFCVSSPRPGFPTSNTVIVGAINITGGVGTGFIGLDAVTAQGFIGAAHSYDLYLQNGAQIEGNASNLNNLHCRNAKLNGTSQAAFIDAQETHFEGNVTIDGDAATMLGCEFGIGCVITFSALAGTLDIDDRTLTSFRTAGATLVNGSVSLQEHRAAMYEATAGTNTVGSAGSANLLAVTGNAFAEREPTIGAGWTFTPTGCVATATGPKGLRFLVSIKASVFPAAPPAATKSFGIAVAFNGDLIGASAPATFTGGIQRSGLLTGDDAFHELSCERVIVLTAVGNTVQPVLQYDGTQNLSIAKMTMTITPVG